MGSERTFLTTHNLCIGYPAKGGENRLLTNLNLSLRESQMVCFMGPNGSGKSSLLRTLAGLQKPISGSVSFPGADHSHRVEHKIAVVLTDRIQAVNLTVEEVIAFGRYPHLGWNITLSNTDREHVTRAIDQVRIQHLLKKRVYELSDGQLQMVMIARALAQDTPILLLDEPTAHLDLNNRVEIMNLLRDLSRSMHKAILLATHELDLALQTADRIWLTGKNNTIQEGLPEDLVLNGSFDEIFRFKGFDLKTGKVIHQPFRNISIQLIGEGAAYLWTKNALERNGFDVSDVRQPISITVLSDSSSLRWSVTRSEGVEEVSTIEELITSL